MRSFELWHISNANLRQTGDYLFVIKPAGEPGECSVTFKINN